VTTALEGGEWSAAHPGCTLPPGKDPVPILQEAGWAPGLVWTGGKSHPHRDSILAHPALSQLLYQLSNLAHRSSAGNLWNVLEKFSVEILKNLNQVNTMLNLLAPELFFKILAHSVYKM